jgi:hypothetical protein
MRFLLATSVVAFLCVVWVAGALAAPAKSAKKPPVQPDRYKAVEICTREARARYREFNSDEFNRNRTFAYATCMARMGFAP